MNNQPDDLQNASQTNCKTAPVSVVIPVYNGAKYLGEAIESVRAQTVSPLQILVIDDGSTDETARVAQSFADVEYHFQPNAGAAAARNNGVQRAKGELLAFLDADDLWTPQKLEWQLALFGNGAKGVMAFGHGEQFISPDLNEEERAKVFIPHERLPAYVASAMLVAREDFLRVGLFDAKLQAGDFIAWYACAVDMKLQARLLPQIVMRRRVHTTNLGISRSDARGDYVRVLKAALDRRRAQQASGKT